MCLLGSLDALDDPRLVRIGHYEDGVTGRHDAAKLLTPFLESFLAKRRGPRVAVVLHDVDSQNKLCQTVLEMMRGGITDLGASVTVFHGGRESLDEEFTSRLPFPVTHLAPAGADWDEALRQRLRDGQFDYVVLFESSGMYRGEDIVSLIAPLLFGRLGAVWGSRRLSVRDIEESHRLRYRHKWLLGIASSVGSYILSLAYLVLYGRYISDTLSGARAMRTGYFIDAGVPLSDKQSNQELLSIADAPGGRDPGSLRALRGAFSRAGQAHDHPGRSGVDWHHPSTPFFRANPLGPPGVPPRSMTRTDDHPGSRSRLAG